MKLLARIIASVLGAGVFYGAWLALVLAVDTRPTAPLPLALDATAPFVTALGFALGALLGDRLTGRTRTRFLRAYLWPLAGCIMGALVVYPFGPMLIVFGMFALGAVAVILEGAWSRPYPRSANNGIQTDSASRCR